MYSSHICGFWREKGISDGETNLYAAVFHGSVEAFRPCYTDCFPTNHNFSDYVTGDRLNHNFPENQSTVRPAVKRLIPDKLPPNQQS